MNEKIKELFHQAYGYPIDVVGEQAEKFAELIVRECIDTVQRRWVGDHNREDQEVLRCVADIKQHFGIEL